MSGDKQRKRRTLALVALMLSSVALAFVGGVAGQQTDTPTPGPIEDNASYYDNENESANMTDWVPEDGNASAQGILEMVSRIPGMFIGTGTQDPSGAGYEGVLLTGLVIGGATLFAVVGVGIGPIAGSMIGVVLAYGLTVVGLVPAWIQPLLLFTLVGIPAAAAMLRVFNR